MEEEKILQSIKKIENIINKLEKEVCSIKEKIEHVYSNIICNDDEIIEDKIKYFDQKIDNIKNEIISETLNIFENFSKKDLKTNESVKNRLTNESKERLSQIEKLNDISEYDKIILKNLESRISILEEETQNYNKLSDL